MCSVLVGWVFCNVVSTLETLAAFVLHITGAGRGGGANGEMLQIPTGICSIEEREGSCSEYQPFPRTPDHTLCVTIRPTSSTFNLGFSIPGLTLHDTNNPSNGSLSQKK